jgi:hypothetical protein
MVYALLCTSEGLLSVDWIVSQEALCQFLKPHLVKVLKLDLDSLLLLTFILHGKHFLL